MKAEKFCGLFVTIVATAALIWGLKFGAGWEYQLSIWPIGILFAIMYNIEYFIPRSKGFNFCIGYIGIALSIAGGRLLASTGSGTFITGVLLMSTILCLLSAYTPVVAYQLGYRTRNKPHFPSHTFMIFIYTAFLISNLV